MGKYSTPDFERIEIVHLFFSPNAITLEPFSQFWHLFIAKKSQLMSI